MSCSLNTKEKKGNKIENAVSEIGTENQKELIDLVWKISRPEFHLLFKVL